MEASSYTSNKKKLAALFFVAFLLRIATFTGFITKKDYYKQPDSIDYHAAALSLSLGKGMTYLGSNRPIFWRTPGYPLYLSWFYNLFGIKSAAFKENRTAQITAILIQILLSSLIPLFIFFLALTLTHSTAISWITAWISVFHLGLILASTYLLTESLALIFFIPFLIFFYRSFSISLHSKWIINIMLAAFFLGITSWIRPMGQFLSLVCIMIILILDLAANWHTRLKKILVFYLIFFLAVSGWYIRNYNLTGKWFYWPAAGLYLNTFPAPKIIRDLTGKPLLSCIKDLQTKAALEQQKEIIITRMSGKHVVGEIVCGKVAWPIIRAHPWLFCINWMQEVLKTTFDLHASQLVSIVRGTFYYDPPEEFLTEKITDCLYKQPMHPFMRIVTYLELLLSIFIWSGLFAGSWLFFIWPLVKWFNVDEAIKPRSILWMKVCPMIAAIIIMTGGFGYARLRLPVDPLMIILSLTFWYWLIKNNKY